MSNCDEAMTKHFDGGRAAIVGLINKAEVSVADINKLRREILGEIAVGREEAEALFALERAGNVKCAEWTAFFVEAITDHVVWQVRPTGVVNTPQAEWLIGQVDSVKSMNGLAVLVNVMAEAQRAPMWLAAAARGCVNAGWPGVNEALAAARQELAQAA